MPRGVLRPKEPKPNTLAKRPNNRWCGHCKRWVHKDLLAGHVRKKHGIVEQPTTVTSANVVNPNRKPTLASAGKNTAKPKPQLRNVYVEPLYDRQPRFESGFRMSQAGLQTLGKRR